MYKFVCSNNHTSYSSSKDGHKDPACPKCGEPTMLVSNESADSPTKAVPND